jgi:hypothetical protein
MAAMGRASRQTPAIIFCTELAAFFAYKGPSHVDQNQQAFEGFELLNFGSIHIRTVGERVLAFTHSGKAGLNEAYSFTVTPHRQNDVRIQGGQTQRPESLKTRPSVCSDRPAPRVLGARYAVISSAADKIRPTVVWCTL